MKNIKIISFFVGALLTVVTLKNTYALEEQPYNYCDNRLDATCYIQWIPFSGVFWLCQDVPHEEHRFCNSNSL